MSSLQLQKQKGKCHALPVLSAAQCRWSRCGSYDLASTSRSDPFTKHMPLADSSQGSDTPSAATTHTLAMLALLPSAAASYQWLCRQGSFSPASLKGKHSQRLPTLRRLHGRGSWRRCWSHTWRRCSKAPTDIFVPRPLGCPVSTQTSPSRQVGPFLRSICDRLVYFSDTHMN